MQATLKDLRKSKGILAKKIAEWLGITYRQYHRIELGKVKLDKLKVEKLSQIYDVDVTDIEEVWGKGREICEKSS